MSFFILSASHRPNSQSKKVGEFIESRIKNLFPGQNCDLFSLENNPIPLWDSGVWEGTETWTQAWTPVKERLEKASAFIAITPEWGGMATPGIRNFLLLASGGPLSHKPGLIVSVSASRNGAYPVSELRANTTKNNQLCWIPEHVIVRDVESMLNEETPANQDDSYIRGRIDYALKLLNEYSKSLEDVRKSGVIDAKNYPFGM